MTKEELEKENRVLTQNLEDSEIIIAGLKAQIEKMKCCFTWYEHCKTDKHEKWQLRR